MEFEKLNVYENFEVKDIVDFEARNLINYYCCQENLNSTFYSPKEILHLADVKELINVINNYLYINVAALIVCIFYLIYKKQYKISVSNINSAAIVTVICIIALWFFSKMHFDQFFANFHRLTFNNNYWLLPADSNLIKLFPAQFYVDFANQVALQTITMAISIIVAAQIVKKANASQQH